MTNGPEGDRDAQQEQLIHEQKSEIARIMQTEVWGTLPGEALHIPFSQVEVKYVERDLLEPAEATEYRQGVIRSQLIESRDKFTTQDPQKRYEIRLDNEREGATGREALFEEGREKPLVYDGPNTTLAQEGIRYEGGKVIIPLHEIAYSEWTACADPKYLEIFRRNGLPLPYAGFGVSVLFQTPSEKPGHGRYPLTQRNSGIPVYPGRLYSVGGGPLPGQTLTEAINEKIGTITGMVDGKDYNASDMEALAIIEDKRYAFNPLQSDALATSRPELVLRVPVDISYDEIEERTYEKAGMEGKPPNAFGMVAAPVWGPSLLSYIVSRGYEMCPPLEAQLAHAYVADIVRDQGYEAAIAGAKQLTDALNNSERPNFIPSIIRL